MSLDPQMPSHFQPADGAGAELFALSARRICSILILSQPLRLDKWANENAAQKLSRRKLTTV